MAFRRQWDINEQTVQFQKESLSKNANFIDNLDKINFIKNCRIRSRLANFETNGLFNETGQ